MDPSAAPGSAAAAVMARIRSAINAHDLAALAACFAPDYLSEFPAHPDRTFRGHPQMRKNWTQIFAMVPDISAVIESQVVSENHIWTEWTWTGTRQDGSPFAMRGVTISVVEQDRVVAVRLYMEPVEEADAGSNAAIRTQLHAGGPS